MANKLIVTVGSDRQTPGKFYWHIKGSGHNPILVVRDFNSLDEAYIDLDNFKKDLLNAQVIENV